MKSPYTFYERFIAAFSNTHPRAIFGERKPVHNNIAQAKMEKRRLRERETGMSSDDNSIIEPEDQFGPPGEAYREIIREQRDEIDRLKDELSRVGDIGEWMDKDAEIDLLKNDVELLAQNEIYNRHLIRQLAQELGAYHRNYNLISPKIDQLLKDAWKAAQ